MNKSIHNIHVYCTLTVLQLYMLYQWHITIRNTGRRLESRFTFSRAFQFLYRQQPPGKFCGVAESRLLWTESLCRIDRSEMRASESSTFAPLPQLHRLTQTKIKFATNFLLHVPFLMLYLPAFCCTDWSQVCSCSSRSATETMSDCPHLLHVQCFCMYTLYSSAASDAAKLAKVKRITLYMYCTFKFILVNEVDKFSHQSRTRKEATCMPPFIGCVFILLLSSPSFSSVLTSGKNGNLRTISVIQ